MPSILRVILPAVPDLQQDPPFPRCCLSEWFFQELFENVGLSVACLASVSVKFRSKEQGTSGKHRATENPVPHPWFRATSFPSPKPGKIVLGTRLRSAVFLCSETTRKRSLRRLIFFSHFHVVILNASYSPKILHANCFYNRTAYENFAGGGKGGKSRCIMGHVRVANTAVFDQAQVTNSRMIDKWRCKT